MKPLFAEIGSLIALDSQGGRQPSEPSTPLQQFPLHPALYTTVPRAQYLHLSLDPQHQHNLHLPPPTTLQPLLPQNVPLQHLCRLLPVPPGQPQQPISLLPIALIKNVAALDAEPLYTWHIEVSVLMRKS